MNNAIDITLENTGVVMEVENFDTENNTILVSLSRNGVDADVDSVAPSITVDFGSLPQNVYWDEIQDKPDFHPVATSGDYDDLENKPNLHQVATTGDYQDLENKPNLSEVATSGDYGELTGKPRINNVTLDGNKSAANLGLATAEQAIPPGGTTGYVLAKRSDEDNDVEWVEQTGGGSGNYEELENLPSVNGVTLMGDLETEDLNIMALTNEEINQLLV